eukprot:CAMPEP_0177672272 /NCGR_PEP_ID=MMETSP0447-20121125/25231_1 /TAXON_ID=0 /ORGANISM="Stygamoeba regulata, Strain BSH-02190019" /LENGTH=259 /DNA_ID=CAMNT_0019179885 /DNA_START=205 /DNA_END=981 /DNA_ORIENTATION=-
MKRFRNKIGSRFSKADKRLFGCSADSTRGAIFLDSCMAYLVDGGGLKEVGIFRIAGSLTTMNEVKKALQTGKKQGFCEPDDPHVVASLMKVFLREMQEPCIVFDLYPAFIEAMRIEDSTSQLDMLKQLLPSLPLANLHCLSRVTGFLKLVSEFEEFNRMPAKNLAIVFAPNLLRPRVDTPETIIADARFITEAVTLMIENHPLLFENITDLVLGIEGTFAARPPPAERPHRTVVETSIALHTPPPGRACLADLANRMAE